MIILILKFAKADGFDVNDGRDARLPIYEDVPVTTTGGTRTGGTNIKAVWLFALRWIHDGTEESLQAATQS